MDKLFLERIAKQLAFDYLSVLKNPKNFKNGCLPSKTIVLYNADEKILNEMKNSMQNFFSKNDDVIKVKLEKEVDILKNHNYIIDVTYFLENPPKNY